MVRAKTVRQVGESVFVYYKIENGRKQERKCCIESIEGYAADSPTHR